MDIINTSGRRKTSIARVYMKQGNGTITINKRTFEDYFPNEILRASVNQPFTVLSTQGQYDVTANIKGGGITGQAEALRLAIAKALVKVNEEHKSILRANDLITRDPRMVERKKPGQKKARKKFQFSKR
jgi:small subunit ribosomal protein S9